MPNMHLFPPANPYALAHDHMYTQLSAENQFLSKELVSHCYHISEKFNWKWPSVITAKLSTQ